MFYLMMHRTSAGQFNKTDTQHAVKIYVYIYLSLPVALDHVFFYRCDVHFAVLFVLLVSVGGMGRVVRKKTEIFQEMYILLH